MKLDEKRRKLIVERKSKRWKEKEFVDTNKKENRNGFLYENKNKNKEVCCG